MATFTYEAVTSEGGRIKDEGEFSSPAELYRHLRNQGLTLLKYKRRRFSFSKIIPCRIKRTQLAEFLRNLALVLKGGVTLREALSDFAASPGIPCLKHVIRDLVKRIEGGELFSEALSHHPKIFPNIVIVLVRLGEETGRLDKTLEDGADHLERVQEIIDKTKRAVSYPAVVLFAMTGALAFWLLYVMPKLFELFRSLGLKELPWATRFLFDAVAALKTWWPVFPMILIMLIVFRLSAIRNEKIKFIWDNIWTRAPLAGTIIKSSQLAFFFEYLSLLTVAGVDVIRSLEIMESAVTHQILKRGITRIRSEVIGGSGLTEAFQNVSLFEPFILRMVKVGEQTGNMPEQMKILSDHYMVRVNRLVDSMAKALEPALIIFAGMVFLIIAMGLLGPIYDMMGKIR